MIDLGFSIYDAPFHRNEDVEVNFSETIIYMYNHQYNRTQYLVWLKSFLSEIFPAIRIEIMYTNVVHSPRWFCLNYKQNVSSECEQNLKRYINETIRIENIRKHFLRIEQLLSPGFGSTFYSVTYTHNLTS